MPRRDRGRVRNERKGSREEDADAAPDQHQVEDLHQAVVRAEDVLSATATRPATTESKTTGLHSEPHTNSRTNVHTYSR